MRFAIKHKPTNKFLHSDEQGTILLDKNAGFFTWGLQSDAELVLTYYESDEFILDDITGNKYSILEFIVAKV